MAGLGCSNGKKSKGIRIETVELTPLTEARDDGLGTREAQMGVLIGQLRDQTAQTSGARQLSALAVCNPGLLCFSLT